MGHAIKRAKERYGLELTNADLASIAGSIRRNQGKFVGYMDEGRTAWKLKWRKTWMRVLISKDFYGVITFLPLSGPLHLKRVPYKGGKVA